MEEYYMGSADWMPRNLDKRVEILFPVEDEKLKTELRHILQIQLDDNVKSHILQPDGSYVKVNRRGKKRLCAPGVFLSGGNTEGKSIKESGKRQGIHTGRVC